jgi:hypothetical protein
MFKILHPGFTYNTYGQHRLSKRALSQYKQICYIFGCNILEELEDQEILTTNTVFRDEATFRLSRHDKRYNVRILESCNLHATLCAFLKNIFWDISSLSLEPLWLP